MNPNITFKVTDSFNRAIGNGVVLRVGDFVRFVISLVLDGKSTTFTLRLIQCTNSDLGLLLKVVLGARTFRKNLAP